jgi:3-methyladenine DNA glycosylase Tag
MPPRLRSGRTYHDDSPWPHLELGPDDDRRYFEQLVKAIFQAGLRWPVIESRWLAFGEVFHGFDPVAVAAMTERDVDRAARDPRIVRHHRKIGAAVECAALVNELIAEHGSFDAYLRSFGSAEDEIDELQRRFPGLGDFSAWWFMQSVGLPVPPTG